MGTTFLIGLRKDVRMESGPDSLASWKMEEGNHKPGKLFSLRSWSKGRAMSSSLDCSKRNTAPTDTLMLAQSDSIGLLTSRAIRQ